jgi:hypothetical protein
MKRSKATLSMCSFLVVFTVLFFGIRTLRADTGSNGYGYLWSSNIGWMKLNDCNTPGDADTCSTSASYGVTVLAAAPGTISGYAWSSNIGWITFNDPTCPTTGCTPGTHAVWNTDGTGTIVGWARACSVYASGCSGTLNDNAVLGSWDGYIALDSTTAGGSAGTWGLTIAKDGTISGYAWGSEVLGWIKSINASFDLSGPAVQLVANPASILKGANSLLTATATNIDGSNSCTIAGVDGLVMTENGTVWTGSVSVSPSVKTAYTVTCTKGTQKATASATVAVTYIVCPNGGCPGTGPGGTGGTGGTGNEGTGDNSGGTGGYCAIDNPQFAWDSDATECKITEQGGGSTGWLAASSQAQGGTLNTADGLYYYSVDLPVIGSSSVYTFACDGGSIPITIQTTVSACTKDFLLNAVPNDASSSTSSEPLTPSADGKYLTGSYTVSATPEYTFDAPISLQPVQVGTSGLPSNTIFTFSNPTLSYSNGTFSTSVLTLSIPAGDVKQSAGYSPIIIYGTGGGFTHTAEVSADSTVKIQPVFKEF